MNLHIAVFCIKGCITQEPYVRLNRFNLNEHNEYTFHEIQSRDGHGGGTALLGKIYFLKFQKSQFLINFGVEIGDFGPSAP